LNILHAFVSKDKLTLGPINTSFGHITNSGWCSHGFNTHWTEIWVCPTRFLLYQDVGEQQIRVKLNPNLYFRQHLDLLYVV